MRGLDARLARIVYGEPAPEEISAELRLISEADRAHVVMLTERGLMSRADAAALLELIERLREEDFRPLHGVETPRGLYLAYERHLISALGVEVAGRLHTGRSRNDLKATTTVLRLRRIALDLLTDLTRLQAVLLGRARAHRDTVMPIYTHYQAAMPVTYGFHLLGVAVALSRDVAALVHEVGGLRRCPLGAGAVAGTDLPLDPARTAALLGFEAGPLHAVDAVAARDAPLRVLAAACAAGLTLTRLAADLQLWSTAEFGFLDFPDRLVGGSSAMPQKRNAFLLEHVKARPAAAIGAWASAAAAMKAAPFTNSIEVGTEAVAMVWPGLAAVADAVSLARALVAGARPRPERMRARAEDGFVNATALANRLVLDGVPFRAAHEQVGAAVRQAIAAGATRLPVGDLPELDELVRRQRVGGGPGAFGAAFEAVRAELAGQREWLCARRAALADAAAALAEATRRIRAGE